MFFRQFSRSEPKEAREILDEHARLRGRLVELAIDLDLHCLRPETVSAFVDELRSHAAREELLLYPWAARQLGNVVGVHLRQALSVGDAGDATVAEPREEWRIDPDPFDAPLFAPTHRGSRDQRGRSPVGAERSRWTR